MQLPASSADFIYRTRDAIMAADALAVAIVHRDLFTVLDRSPADVAALCDRFGLHRRPFDVLCTLVISQGLLARDAAGRLASPPCPAGAGS